MKKLVLIVTVLLLSSTAANAQVTGNTACSITSFQKMGMGPWGIQTNGTVSIDSTVISFDSLTYSITDPNGNPVMGAMAVLTNGNPTPGGAAAPWKGTGPALTVPGAYTITATMRYHDQNNNPRMATATGTVSVP
jgi:hypothetical protein